MCVGRREGGEEGGGRETCAGIKPGIRAESPPSPPACIEKHLQSRGLSPTSVPCLPAFCPPLFFFPSSPFPGWPRPPLFGDALAQRTLPSCRRRLKSRSDRGNNRAAFTPLSLPLAWLARLKTLIGPNRYLDTVCDLRE